MEVTSADGTGELWQPAGIDSTPAERFGAPAHAVAVTLGSGAALGQLTTNDGKVPTVQPFAPVGAGAAVPVPPLAIESGSDGPGESVAQIGTSTVKPVTVTFAPHAVAAAEGMATVAKCKTFPMLAALLPPEASR